MPADDGRMDAARYITELLERRRDLPASLIEARPRVRVACQPLLEQAELERQGDKPLLCAVVKVPFQPLALLLPRLDHARARSPELCEPSSQLCVQARVLEGDSGRRGDGIEQLRLVFQRRVVQ